MAPSRITIGHIEIPHNFTISANPINNKTPIQYHHTPNLNMYTPPSPSPSEELPTSAAEPACPPYCVCILVGGAVPFVVVFIICCIGSICDIVTCPSDQQKQGQIA